MTVLLDTDILIDVGLSREPFFDSSAKVVDLCEKHAINGYIAWHTLSNFYYLISSSSGKAITKRFLSDLLKFIEVSPTGKTNAQKALLMDVPDFEDALQISAAIECKADFIITRNTKHYKKSQIKAITPEEFIKSINKLT